MIYTNPEGLEAIDFSLDSFVLGDAKNFVASPKFEASLKYSSHSSSEISGIMKLSTPCSIDWFYLGLHLGFPEQDIYYIMALGTYDRKEILLASFITIIYNSQSSIFAVYLHTNNNSPINSFCGIINYHDIENIYFESEFNEWFRPDLSSLSITTS
jgi:hypothetical protein